MNRVHYQVTGIQNTQIKTQVKNVLDELDGVSMVNVDMGRGSVEVGYNDPATEEEIKACIEHVEGCTIS